MTPPGKTTKKMTPTKTKTRDNHKEDQMRLTNKPTPGTPPMAPWKKLR